MRSTHFATRGRMLTPLSVRTPLPPGDTNASVAARSTALRRGASATWVERRGGYLPRPQFEHVFRWTHGISLAAAAENMKRERIIEATAVCRSQTWQRQQQADTRCVKLNSCRYSQSQSAPPRTYPSRTRHIRERS